MSKVDESFNGKRVLVVDDDPVIRTVDSVIFAYDKVEKTEFSKFLEDNTYHWTAPDRPPLPPITSVSSSLGVFGRSPNQRLLTCRYTQN